MITIKTSQEIEILKEGGKILASVLHKVAEKVEPGISAQTLDVLARNLIAKAGGRPAFLGYRPAGSREPYPAALCVSINDEVVHGLPLQTKILKDGDIVGLDLGLEYKKLFTDMAVTVGVGNINKKEKKLIKTAKQALTKGVEVLKEGSTLGDYGFIVERITKKNGFNVVRNLVGHGVGYGSHEDPDIPNYGREGQGLELKTGMVLALEPMVCEGRGDVVLDKDGWTWRTKDGLKSAHFEHTVVVEKDKAVVLTKI